MSTYDTDLRSDLRDRFGSGWGPVLSGAAAAFLTFITFSAMWLAIGVGTGNGWITGNLAWFEFITALAAAPVGGFVTGWLQRGDRMSGMLRGFSSWGLVLAIGLVIGVPASTAIFAGATNVTLQTLTQGGNVAQQLGAVSGELWAIFAIFGGGAILAALAGGAGATSEHRTETGHRERAVERRETEVRSEPATRTETRAADERVTTRESEYAGHERR